MTKVIGEAIAGGCILYRLPPKMRSTPTVQMPVGKYRGIPISLIVDHDPQHIGWLIGQDWFFEKFPTESECLVKCISIDPDAQEPGPA